MRRQASLHALGGEIEIKWSKSSVSGRRLFNSFLPTSLLASNNIEPDTRTLALRQLRVMQASVLVMALLSHGVLAMTVPTYHQRALEGVDASDLGALTPASREVSGPSRSESTRRSALDKRVVTSRFVNQPFMRRQFSNQTYSWMLRLELVHALEPIQTAATILIPFYDHMREELVQQWSQGTLANSVRWQLGDVILDMRSRDHDCPISPAMVFEMLGMLKGFAQRNMVGTFEGEVVSMMTGLSIWVRLRIR